MKLHYCAYYDGESFEKIFKTKTLKYIREMGANIFESVNAFNRDSLAQADP